MAADRGPGLGQPRPEVLLAFDRRHLDGLFDEPTLARLRSLARLDPALPLTDELRSPAARARLAEVDVLITSWGAPLITPEVLASAPRLRAVLHAAGSVREQVTPAVFDRGILVTSAAEANAVPVAEYALAAILWAGKRVPWLARDARRFREDWSYRARRLEGAPSGRTVGLVGFSRVGRRVADLLRPFDIRVLVADPYADPVEILATGAEPLPLPALLPQVDVLSLHAPLLPETRGMIGAAQLAALRGGATVVNTARGGLIDRAALERECGSGRLYAVLDVTEPEHLPADSPLYDAESVMITPHVAGSLGDELLRMSARALDELERFARGEPPLDAVTPEVLAHSA